MYVHAAPRAVVPTGAQPMWPSHVCIVALTESRIQLHFCPVAQPDCVSTLQTMLVSPGGPSMILTGFLPLLQAANSPTTRAPMASFLICAPFSFPSAGRVGDPEKTAARN